MSKKRLKRIEAKLNLLLELSCVSLEQANRSIGGGGVKNPPNDDDDNDTTGG